MPDKSPMESSILLLISEPLVRLVIQELLERAGYLVIATGDLGAAVDRMGELTPDLLIISPYVETITGNRGGQVPTGALAGHAHPDGGGSFGRRTAAVSRGTGKGGDFPGAVHRAPATRKGAGDTERGEAQRKRGLEPCQLRVLSGGFFSRLSHSWPAMPRFWLFCDLGRRICFRCMPFFQSWAGCWLACHSSSRSLPASSTVSLGRSVRSSEPL